jgi:nicotinamidase-related amidase
MPRFPRSAALFVAGCLVLPLVAAEKPLTVTARSRTNAATTEKPRTLDPRHTAVIICDMWDDHWCRSAAKRCDVLAKKAAPVVEALRQSGATIIHCPSDCMAYYKEHPARKRAQAVKPTAPPKPKNLPNPPLPIDDSDGGCDDGPTPFRKAWTKEHAALRIDPDRDFVTDKGSEVYSILADRGIKTVLVMGVHTNMCVLNRTFAIKQLCRWGVDCLLVRDLTDAMYNPKMRPFVSHDAGTSLVIAYIERNWCPSIASTELVKK